MRRWSALASRPNCARLTFFDIGASDGITTVEAVRALQRAYLADRNLSAVALPPRCYCRAPCSGRRTDYGPPRTACQAEARLERRTRRTGEAISKIRSTSQDDATEQADVYL